MKYLTLLTTLIICSCSTYSPYHVDYNKCFDRRYYCSEQHKVITVKQCESGSRVRTNIRVRVGN